MKKYIKYFSFFAVAVLLSSCFDDKEILFEGSLVEFEDAITRSKASGQTFPIINLTRSSGAQTYQVNLISSQLELPEQITVSLDEVPQSLLNANSIKAEEGLHFTLTDKTFEFPTNASKVSFTGLSVLPGFPAQTGKTALLVLRLDGNEKLKPSENYRRIGIRINLN